MARTILNRFGAVAAAVALSASLASCGDDPAIPRQELSFADDFSDDARWSNETDGAFRVQGEVLFCHVRRDAVQKMCLPIDAYSGGFTMEFDFMWERGDGNVWLEVGLAESLSGALNDPVNDPVGAFLQIGRQGSRYDRQSYYLFPLARYRDETFYRGSFDPDDFVTYLGCSEDAWYRARLEVTGRFWRLTLMTGTGEEAGQKTGTFPRSFGPFRYIYIGNPDDEDWTEGLVFLDNLRVSGEVEWENPCPSPCSMPPADPMPAPTGLILPDEIFFDEPFEMEWDDVWTGCGGYEIAFMDGPSFSIDVANGSSLTLTIPRPDCETIAEYLIRLRSYWGGACDDRVYSAPHPYALAAIRAREDVPLVGFRVGDGDSITIAPGDTIGPIEVPATSGPQECCWRVLAGCFGASNVWGYRYRWGGDWETEWTPYVGNPENWACPALPPLSGTVVFTVGIITSEGEFYYAADLRFP